MLFLEDTISRRSRSIDPVKTRKTYESEEDNKSSENNRLSGIRPRRSNKRKLSDQLSSDSSNNRAPQARPPPSRRQRQPNISVIQEVPDEQMESSGIDNRGGEASDFDVVSGSDHSDPDADRINIRQPRRSSAALLSGNAYDQACAKL